MVMQPVNHGDSWGDAVPPSTDYAEQGKVPPPYHYYPSLTQQQEAYFQHQQHMGQAPPPPYSSWQSPPPEGYGTAPPGAPPPYPPPSYPAMTTDSYGYPANGQYAMYPPPPNGAYPGGDYANAYQAPPYYPNYYPPVPYAPQPPPETQSNSASALPFKRSSAVRRKDKNKPKRPLSAYNLFFKDMREELLKSLPGNGDEPEPEKPQRGKRRKPHGKIGFADLAKTIAAKWKKVEPETLQVYRERADADMERYKKEMDEYTEARKKGPPEEN